MPAYDSVNCICFTAKPLALDVPCGDAVAVQDQDDPVKLSSSPIKVILCPIVDDVGPVIVAPGWGAAVVVVVVVGVAVVVVTGTTVVVVVVVL